MMLDIHLGLISADLDPTISLKQQYWADRPHRLDLLSPLSQLLQLSVNLLIRPHQEDSVSRRLHQEGLGNRHLVDRLNLDQRLALPVLVLAIRPHQPVRKHLGHLHLALRRLVPQRSQLLQVGSVNRLSEPSQLRRGVHSGNQPLVEVEERQHQAVQLLVNRASEPSQRHRRLSELPPLRQVRRHSGVPPSQLLSVLQRRRPHPHRSDRVEPHNLLQALGLQHSVNPVSPLHSARPLLHHQHSDQLPLPHRQLEPDLVNQLSVNLLNRPHRLLARPQPLQGAHLANRPQRQAAHSVRPLRLRQVTRLASPLHPQVDSRDSVSQQHPVLHSAALPRS